MADGHTTAIPAAILQAGTTLGLWPAGSLVEGQPLTGGVSSEIWRLSGLPGGRVVCAKQALQQLKVAADWQVSTERNVYEYRWLATVNGWLPDFAPQVIAYDPERRVLFLEYLPATEFHNLKRVLLDGGQPPDAVFTQLGVQLGVIHAHSAGDQAIAAQFDNWPLFLALRPDPYFAGLPLGYPSLQGVVDRAIALLRETRLALVHGDVSPKNILYRHASGETRVVLLDAETASYGDPAFDMAFLLNHLFIKALLGRVDHAYLAGQMRVLWQRYAEQIHWEAKSTYEGRLVSYLPLLMLARVDGKSPVEYASALEQQRIRQTALRLLTRRMKNLEEYFAVWQELTHVTV